MGKNTSPHFKIQILVKLMQTSVSCPPGMVWTLTLISLKLLLDRPVPDLPQTMQTLAHVAVF